MRATGGHPALTANVTWRRRADKATDGGGRQIGAGAASGEAQFVLLQELESAILLPV